MMCLQFYDNDIILTFYPMASSCHRYLHLIYCYVLLHLIYGNLRILTYSLQWSIYGMHLRNKWYSQTFYRFKFFKVQFISTIVMTSVWVLTLVCDFELLNISTLPGCNFYVVSCTCTCVGIFMWCHLHVHASAFCQTY